MFLIGVFYILMLLGLYFVSILMLLVLLMYSIFFSNNVSCLFALLVQCLVSSVPGLPLTFVFFVLASYLIVIFSVSCVTGSISIL